MNANDNQVPLELMQPDISGQIKQTNLEELKNWIKNGDLLPHHQVRVKNLTWIEARKFPALKPLFEQNENQTDQSNNFFNPPSPKTSVSEQKKPELTDAPIQPKETPVSAADDATKNMAKTVEPSAVYKAFEKKALAKSKPSGRKAETVRPLPKPQKKSSIVKQTAIFLAGCIIVFLLSFGGSYLWNYQLKSPVEVDEKSLPELASLTDKLTSDKLDLRLKAARENNQTDISQQVVQLEKQYDSQRKTVIENQRNKLQNADFYPTFYFSLAILMGLFFMTRIYFGKTSQPAEIRYSSKLPAPKSSRELDVPSADNEDIATEDSESREVDSEVGETTEAESSSVKKSLKKSRVNSENDGEISDKKIENGDDSEMEESETTDNCVLHKGRSSVFICEVCENHFCNECLKTFGDVEKCCPFCKVVCKSLESNREKIAATKPKKKENKPVNLLDLNKDNSDFIVYDYADEERSRVAGIIQAFVIALLFSAAISILWTYKIQPYLENRNKETVENVSSNKTENDGQIPLNADPETYNKEIDDALKTGPCIDPETKQPFDCDEETRRALYDHTRKTQSVEKAKKDVFKTAELISGPNGENKEPEDPQISAAKAEQKKKETRQLIVSFSISFALIFGLLLAIVFLSKDKKTFLNQNTDEETDEETE